MRNSKEQSFGKIRKPLSIFFSLNLFSPSVPLNTINGFNIWKRNIPYILLRYLLYCSKLMEFLSYSILVIFEIIVSRNITTISPQDEMDNGCWRNSLIWRSDRLLAIVPWHFYLYPSNCLPHWKIHIPTIHFQKVCLLTHIVDCQPSVW